jgi:hypothetical protein
MIPGQLSNFLSVSVGPITGHSWKRLVQRALRENDPAQLLQCVDVTEIAMLFRWQELGKDIDAEELVAMQAAADNLLIIKTHRLGWPGFQR